MISTKTIYFNTKHRTLSRNRERFQICLLFFYTPCIIPDNSLAFQNQFIRHLKQHAFESYFSIWIISHSSQDRNQREVNYEDRTKGFLTDGNCESAMEKTIALLEAQWNVFYCTLANGTFLISRDHNEPIKRPEFNEVLYKHSYCRSRLPAFSSQLAWR